MFTDWEGGGNITPALEAVGKLARRGHRVRFMGEECNRAGAETAGATFVSWKRPPIGGTAAARARGPTTGPRRRRKRAYFPSSATSDAARRSPTRRMS